MITWAQMRTALEAILNEIAVEGETITVLADPPGTLTDGVVLALFPPGKIILRGSGIRRTTYDVLIRAYVVDRDLDSSLAVLESLSAALVDVFDGHVGMGGLGYLTAQTVARPGTIDVGGKPTVAVDCTLAIEAFEPAVHGAG